MLVELVGIDMLWSRAREIEGDVATLIPGWYPYEYDGDSTYGMNRINYGGSVFTPLFYHGNAVSNTSVGNANLK